MARNAGKLAAARQFQIGHWQSAMGKAAAFTMIEIAICLAIIGFALVAIIGVLPLGMNTQRDVREETVINQDATVLLDLIRSGARNGDYLTNYVYAITNYATYYDDKGVVQNGSPHTAGYTYLAASYDGVPNNYQITNAVRILGVLGTPEFTDWNGKPLADTFSQDYVSNHVVAYVRAMSGLASDRPPQDNALLIGDSFAYRLYCVNAPMAVDTNTFIPPNNLPTARSSYATQLAGNQRELRLTFLWPQLPNGNYGNGRQTFRATVAGQMSLQNYNGETVYFYQPQLTNSP
jgi:type II secretory pathway pseudopilin PulG